MCGVRIEYDDVVSTDETWHIGYIIDCVEAKTKSARYCHCFKETLAVRLHVTFF